MRPWRWTLLLFELFLFALILVLPQVDLPDFTFQGGTAPVVAKARISPTPVRPAAVLVSLPTPAPIASRSVEATFVAAPMSLSSRLSLFCSLIC